MSSVYIPDDRVAFAQTLQRDPHLHYDFKIERVDIFGSVLSDITSRVIRSTAGSSPPSVEHTSTDTNPGTLSFVLDRSDGPLVWGADLVRPTMLVRPTFVDQVNALGFSFPPGQVFGFPQSVFIVATPTDDMKSGAQSSDKSPYQIVAYDKTYLLRGDVGDTFAATAGEEYSHALMRLMVLAGLTDADDGSGNLNPDLVRFSPDWVAKTIPSSKYRVWPCDDSNNFSFIDIANALLKSSGQLPLYTDNDGWFVVSPIAKPQSQSALWTFSRNETVYDADWFANSAVMDEDSSHENDVWNLPNRFVFIQTGLTFNPTHDDGSDGRYVVNNAEGDSHYVAGSDQQTIGRVIASVQRLDAHNQADLIAQAERIYTETFASAESIRLSTAPWPCAGHFDVFRYADAALDGSVSRKLQAQSWTLQLDGMAPMEWETHVVVKT